MATRVEQCSCWEVKILSAGEDHEADIHPSQLQHALGQPRLLPAKDTEEYLRILLMAREVWLHDFDEWESAVGSDVSASPLHEGERGAGLYKNTQRYKKTTGS